MSRFHGEQAPRAMRRHREKKRQEATKRAENRLVAQNLTALADQARAAAQATVVTAELDLPTSGNFEVEQGIHVYRSAEGWWSIADDASGWYPGLYDAEDTARYARQNWRVLDSLGHICAVDGEDRPITRPDIDAALARTGGPLS